MINQINEVISFLKFRDLEKTINKINLTHFIKNMIFLKVF